MPKRKGAWASWVYLSEGKQDSNNSISLSYWMNRLQNIESVKPIIVTLNTSRKPNPQLVHDEHVFEHPVFDEAAISAQDKVDSIQGQNNTWYCGAYLKYGFHEDGFSSAVKVAQKLGVNIPWH
jgi:predicted NAD/FAD-binding protein